MSTTAAPDRFTTLPDENTLQATVVALEEHGFSVEVVSDLDAARQAVLARIPAGSPVMTNTSVTLAETGLADAINDGGGRWASGRNKQVGRDFGLAAVTDQLRGSEARSGTPAYMAPEQLRGEQVTAKSDIYALGMVLYEIFTGKRAYEAATMADLIRLQERAQITSMSSIAAEIDPAVEKAIRRCLDPDPAKRPASALMVAAALPGGDPLAAALAAGETPSPDLVAASGETEGLPLKKSVPLALALAALIIAVPLVRTNVELHSLVPFELSPDALAAKVRREI